MLELGLDSLLALVAVEEAADELERVGDLPLVCRLQVGHAHADEVLPDALLLVLRDLRVELEVDVHKQVHGLVPRLVVLSLDGDLPQDVKTQQLLVFDDTHYSAPDFKAVFLFVDDFEVVVEAFYLGVGNALVDECRVTKNPDEEIFSFFIIKKEVLLRLVIRVLPVLVDPL